MKTALLLALCAVAALAHSHEEFTAEQKAELDAKIAKLSPEAQEAAKKIKGIFEANEGNKDATMEQTKTLMASLPEGVVAEIKSIMPPHLQTGEAAPAVPAPSRARRQEPTKQPESAAVEGPQQQEIMNTLLVLSAVALCAFANFEASPAPLSAEKKAEIKAKVLEKLATLSADAQTAGKEIVTAFEANEGNMEATKAAVESILSGVSDSVKQDLASILPGGRHFLGHHRQTTASA